MSASASCDDAAVTTLAPALQQRRRQTARGVGALVHDHDAHALEPRQHAVAERQPCRGRLASRERQAARGTSRRVPGPSLSALTRAAVQLDDAGARAASPRPSPRPSGSPPAGAAA